MKTRTLVGEAFRAGASAFLLKQAAAFELMDAIERVLKGGSYVTPSAAEGQAKISLRDPRSRTHVAEPTPRQREVIQLLAEGAFHEGSRFRSADHQTDGCSTQVRRNGSFAKLA